MGFPTSAFSKAAITNGQTSDPADVNDVYTELTNITDGIINGGAPIHTSNASVTNLNVGGNSTVAGELFVTKCPPHARVYNNTVVGIADSTRTFLTFDTEHFVSTSAMHSTASNAGRLVAASTGIYQVTGHVGWNQSSTSGIRHVEIWLNSTQVLASQRTRAGQGVGGGMYQSIETVVRLSSATDYVELAVIQDSGSTDSLLGGIGNQGFTLTKIR